ncbi:MAG: Calx-beta domain-containing protein [Solirubrobacterales bacterium]
MRRGLSAVVLGAAALLMAMAAAPAEAAWHELIGGANPVNHDALSTADNPSMAVVDGVPWIAWDELAGASNRQVHVAKLNAAGDDWVEVGGPLNHTPTANAAGPDLTTVNGVPYVAWVEDDGTNLEARVAKLNAGGTGWTEIDGGSPSSPINRDSTKSAGSVSLADVGGVPYIAWSEETSVNKAQVWVDKLSGGAWTQVGGSSPLNYAPDQQAGGTVIAAIGGAPYVAWVENYGNGQVHVATLNESGTGWTFVGSGASPINRGDPDNPALGAYGPDLIGIGGDPYVAWNEIVLNSPLEVYVSRWTGSSWAPVGSGSDPVSGGGASPAYGPSLASIGGVPYIAESEYNNGQEIWVKRFNGTAWDTVDAATNPLNGAYSGNDGLSPELVGSGGAPVVAWSQYGDTGQQIRVSTDDPPISFSSSTYSTSESAGIVNVTVQRSGGAGRATVDYATADGTAHQPGDYSASSGTLTFAPGETSKTFPVAIVSDSDPEPDETVDLTLSNPGGTGELGTPATATLTITDDDTVDTQIDSGPSGATNDNTPTFAFSANRPSSTFKCGLDTIQIANYSSCTAPKTYDSPSLADGIHTFAVFATAPGAGADPTPAFRDFFVDTHAPSTAISIQPYLDEGQSFGSNKFAGRIQIAGTPSDPAPSSGAGASRCALDPATPPASFSEMTQPCTSPAGWVVTPAPGAHTVYSASRDPAGNTGPVVSTTFTILAKPTVTITGGPDGFTWFKSPEFSFDSPTPGAGFRCRLDTDAFSPCTSPWLAPARASGPHSFEVKAVTAEGVESDVARRTYAIEEPETASFNCELKPYLGINRGEQYACVISTVRAGSPSGDFCAGPAIHRCVGIAEQCALGALCSLTTTTVWRDADKLLYRAFSRAAMKRWPPPPGSGKYPDVDRYCDVRGGGSHTCQTSANLTAFGENSDLAFECSGPESDYLANAKPGDIGPDSERSLRCEASLKIVPADALAIIGQGTSLSVNAPGAGSVRVAPAGGGRIAGSSVMRSTGGRAKPPFKAVTRTAAGAGPLSFKPKLSKPAKRKLAKKHKLKLKLSITYKPEGGEATTKTSRVTLKSQARKK